MLTMRNIPSTALMARDDDNEDDDDEVMRGSLPHVASPGRPRGARCAAAILARSRYLRGAIVMKGSSRLRRDLRLLKIYVSVSTIAFVVLAAAAFRQAAAPVSPAPAAQPQTQSQPSAQATKIDELTVQRFNVVDANGTLRMVIANKDRMHPGVVDGVTINRPRPVAGLIFFNDVGDEVGGMVWSGEQKDGGAQAHGMLAFDQWKQDQTVAIRYQDRNGERTAGLEVWDRSNQPLSGLITKLNEANAMKDAADRDKALAAIRATAPAGPRRVFVGKQPDKSAVVMLADGDGKPRLRLSVKPDGTSAIEFLDANGKVTRQIPSR
jgi:hypothetical protein